MKKKQNLFLNVVLGFVALLFLQGCGAVITGISYLATTPGLLLADAALESTSSETKKYDESPEIKVYSSKMKKNEKIDSLWVVVYYKDLKVREQVFQFSKQNLEKDDVLRVVEGGPYITHVVLKTNERYQDFVEISLMKNGEEILRADLVYKGESSTKIVGKNLASFIKDQINQQNEKTPLVSQR